MLNSDNMVMLTGNLVRDAEVKDNLMTFSIAVDYARNEKNAESNTGYFDVVFFFNPAYAAPSTLESVKGNADQGKYTKGSRVRIVGKLVQDAWTTDDGKRTKVTIRAESISWGSTGTKTGDSATSGSSSAVADVPTSW